MISGGWTSRRLSVPSQFIFNHVPKTGGNSLLEICRYNLDPSQFSPHLDEPKVRMLPAAQFERYGFVTGHFSLLTQAGFCRSRYSMTLLREPIRRIFSAYTFWHAAAEYNPVTSKAHELSFGDFVRYFIDSPAIVHNPLTHHFAAVGRDCPGYPTAATALLAAAKNNLAAFDFVGICEEFGRSARLLCRELGWRCPEIIPYQNRSLSEASLGQIDPPTMEILLERNRLDLELYHFAIQLFEAREANSDVERAGCVEPNRFVPFPHSHRTERRARVQSVSADWTSDESFKMLEIAVDFRTRAAIPELSLGVQVNDAAGNVVWGVSTVYEGLELDYAAAQDSQAAFILECELPQGLYFVTVALAEPRRLGFHEHWIDHATSFTVSPPRVAGSRYRRGITSREFRSHVIRDVNGQ
jgi:hypothetical protein